MKKRRKSILRNQRGQGMLEYVLMLAVVIAIGVLFKDKILKAIGDKTDGVGQSINSFNP